MVSFSAGGNSLEKNHDSIFGKSILASIAGVELAQWFVDGEGGDDVAAMAQAYGQLEWLRELSDAVWSE